MKTLMFKNLVTVLSISLLGAVGALSASANTDVSLEDQLETLALPANQAPGGVSSEKLYSVQTRFVPLRSRSEVALSGMLNMTADSYSNSQDVALTYRYHLSDKWNLALSGSYTFNSLSAAGDRLLELNDKLPDSVYVKNRLDLLVGYNLFYGKFRLSMDRVFYFDQYVALGPGLVRLGGLAGPQDAPAGVADLGFAFYAGQNTSIRLGLKNYLYNEKRLLSSGLRNHLMAHLDVGYVF
jgi:outer membrane beta-barrel protein